jgi:trk system potassium uptake protein TrkA
VERDEETCRRLSETLNNGTLIIHGDGTDQTLLEAENLRASDAFVALTDQDESNLITALCARQMGVPKVVAKITRQNYDNVAHSVGVDSIISPKRITASHILRTVRGMQQSKGSVMQALYKIAGNKAEAMEFIVKENTKHLGVPLRALKLREDILVAVLVHEGIIQIPDGNSSILEGDSVIIISTKRSIIDLNDIFEDEA